MQMFYKVVIEDHTVEPVRKTPPQSCAFYNTLQQILFTASLSTELSYNEHNLYTFYPDDKSIPPRKLGWYDIIGFDGTIVIEKRGKK